ncbi:MAG TPA: DUF177 domain-containing protein [Anaerolineales bacterium]|nr:DUF177 domain-containing protein [Anaerolineales bacterium]
MTNSKFPFRINVGFIVHEEVGYNHEFPFEFESVSFGDDLELKDFSGVIEVGRTSQGLVTTGNFEGETTLECVRCLNDFTHKLDWEITELFAFKSELANDDDVLPLPDSAQIDFAPILREYALLEVPIKPLHSPDCKGLCLECGQDLNVEDCGHEDTDDDNPFSALKELL